MAIPNHINQFRLNAQLTQEALGRELDTSSSAVAKWETGIREVSDEMKLQIAKFFDVPVSAMFDFEFTPLTNALHKTLDQVAALRAEVAELRGMVAA